MPRDFTSIHICAKLCVSRYLQTDRPVDGQIETCMQYTYIQIHILYTCKSHNTGTYFEFAERDSVTVGLLVTANRSESCF